MGKSVVVLFMAAAKAGCDADQVRVDRQNRLRKRSVVNRNRLNAQSRG